MFVNLGVVEVLKGKWTEGHMNWNSHNWIEDFRLNRNNAKCLRFRFLIGVPAHNQETENYRVRLICMSSTKDDNNKGALQDVAWWRWRRRRIKNYYLNYEMSWNCFASKEKYWKCAHNSNIMQIYQLLKGECEREKGQTWCCRIQIKADAWFRFMGSATGHCLRNVFTVSWVE